MRCKEWREDGPVPAKYPHVNQAVKAAIDERGIRVRDLAAALGVHFSTVHRWIAGDDSPRPELWPQLGQALGISLDALHEVSWQTEVEQLKARVDDLEARLATLEAERPAPRLRAAEGPAGAHRAATVKPAKRPAPPAADPDDHTI